MESLDDNIGRVTVRPRSPNELAFPCLADEHRTHVDTACAAYHLGRKAQTLRVWASQENGAMRPVRVHGRLAWSVAEIRKLLNQDSPVARQGLGRTAQPRS